MKISRSLIVAAFLLGSSAVLAQPAAKPAPKNPLVGHWVCVDDGTKVDIRANGTLTIDGTEYAYKVNKSVMTIVGEDGIMSIPFALEGDTLIAEIEGRELTYKRVKPGAKGEGSGTGMGTA